MDWTDPANVTLPSPSSAHHPPRYRADIDGLRAVAVLVVVLQHMRFWHFTGGYIGVDVFFTISGYLIGSSMLAEFRAGSFSLIDYYERRVRRILPALLAMLSVVSVFAYRLLLPGAFVTYAKSLLAATLSASNFFFWTQEGYFISRSTKPLLHTWSLGVEEQFYVLLPLLFYALFRWCPRRVLAALWFLVAVSFLSGCWVVRTDAVTAFFWSPMRAWELLAGILVSQYIFAGFNKRWLRELASLAGLALIAAADLLYTSHTAFPGWTAVVPCLGAALILATGQVGDSTTSRVLALPPLRFVGLISYSLYLWHWPVVVFQNTSMLFTGQPFHVRSTKWIALAVSFLLATLSWRFIEQPFRTGKLRPPRVSLFIVCGATLAVLIAFGLWVVHGRGLPGRLSPLVEPMEAANDAPRYWRSGRCFLQPENTFEDFRPAECLAHDARRRNYLLYGDSLAAALYPGLAAALPEINVQQATASGCTPSGQDDPPESPYRANCVALNGYVHGQYLQDQRPDAVILAAGWSASALPRLEREIAAFQRKGVPVILVGPALAFEAPLHGLLAAEMMRNTPPAQAGAEIGQYLRPENLALDRTLDQLARTRWNVRYASYSKELCRVQDRYPWQTKGGCPLLLDGGAPLMFDDHHLSTAGSVLFAERMRADGLLP